MKPQNRVKELRMVRVGDLVPHPDNWRIHGEEQRGALRTVLERVGIAGATVAFERTVKKGRRKKTELVLIDGHLRREEIGDEVEVPVIVLDVTEDEARLILASHDSIGRMAEADEAQLTALLEGITAADDEMMRELSQRIREEYALWDELELPTSLEATDIVGESTPERSVLAVHFPTNEEATAFLDRLGFDEKEARMRKIPGELLIDKIRSAGTALDD